MNKKDKKIIYSRLEEYLTPYFTNKGFALNKELFAYNKGGFEISWGERADFESWLTFQPFFYITIKEIQTLLRKVFPKKEFPVNTTRAQSTTDFAHEFGVYDFDDSQFNFCAEGVCSYGYRVCLEEEDDEILNGIPILYNVEPIVKDHIAFLEKVAFPYFEKLSTVKGINEYFNTRVLSLSEDIFKDDNLKEKTCDSFQKEEVLSAIVAAYLEDDERFNDIVLQYQKLYAEIDWYLTDINKLVDWINENKNVKNDTTL